METSRLASKSTHYYFYPIESATLSDIIKMADVQCEEQVGFTITHAKTKYGLNCTLPAQSVHCVALPRGTQPRLAPCLIERYTLPSIPLFQKGKTKQQCLLWNVLQVAI